MKAFPIALGFSLLFLVALISPVSAGPGDRPYFLDLWDDVNGEDLNVSSLWVTNLYADYEYVSYDINVLDDVNIFGDLEIAGEIITANDDLFVQAGSGGSGYGGIAVDPTEGDISSVTLYNFTRDDYGWMYYEPDDNSLWFESNAGNIVLNPSSDKNVAFQSHFIPDEGNDGDFDMGSQALRWRNLFLSNDANIAGKLYSHDLNGQFVPYIGATKAVDLGSQDITTTGSGRFELDIQANTWTVLDTTTLFDWDEDHLWAYVDLSGDITLEDGVENAAFDIANRFLYDITGTNVTVDTDNCLLQDATAGNSSIDWQLRRLSASGGSDVILDWSTAGTADFNDSDITTTGDAAIGQNDGLNIVSDYGGEDNTRIGLNKDVDSVQVLFGALSTTARDATFDFNAAGGGNAFMWLKGDTKNKLLAFRATDESGNDVFTLRTTRYADSYNGNRHDDLLVSNERTNRGILFRTNGLVRAEIDEDGETWIEGDLNVAGVDSNIFRVGITDAYIENLTVSDEASIPAIYMQASDVSDQSFAATGTSYKLELDTVDENFGISRIDDGNLLIRTTGIYYIAAQPQVTASAGQSGNFHMWLQKNTGSGFADVVNSNVELTLGSQDEDVIPLIAVLSLSEGDQVAIRASVSNTGITLDTQSPAGEPVIPSIIFSMYKIGN